MGTKKKVIVTEEDFLKIFNEYWNDANVAKRDILVLRLIDNTELTLVAVERRLDRLLDRETHTPLWFALAVVEEMGMEITIK